MNRSLARLACVSLLTFVGACGGKGAQSPSGDFSGPSHAKTSTSADRTALAVTIYNDDFALVREERKVDLGVGRVDLEWRDVASQIQPETVHVKSLDGASALSIFEQDYRYDLLSPAKLLEKYVGKSIKIYRWNKATGKEEPVDAEVLSVAEGNPVFKIGGEVTYGFRGRPSFPGVPPNLIAKPTLVWQLGSAEQAQTVETTYVTRGLGWHTDYVLSIDANDAIADLTGWVTIHNHSGATYADATLKIVAGDVNKIVTEKNEQEIDEADDGVALGKKDSFKEESLFEYHLYSLDRKSTLRDREEKQMVLLDKHAVAVSKRLVFTSGGAWYYQSQYGTVAKDQKVGVFMELENSEANHLGIPLPKGVIRVYKADSSGSQQFVGEDSIDHTPRDEKVRIKVGEAFDVVGDRKQTDFDWVGDCAAESSWEIDLRNHKDTATRVDVVEAVGLDWEVLQSSLKFEKRDSQTLVFVADVPARGETKVTYRIRTKWC